MKEQNTVICFGNVLIDYINQGVRGEVTSFNAIKNGLYALVKISAKNGPIEEMSFIFDRMAEVKAVIEEKSDDFPTDMILFHEVEENFERFFNAELSEPDPLGQDVKDFYNLIKENKKHFKSEIELHKNMATIIHDQKERCG